MFNPCKHICLVLTCMLSLNAVHAQTTNKAGDILFWTADRRLSFADFRGAPHKEDTANARAITHRLGHITKSIDVRLSTRRGKTVFSIYAGMKKDLSWIKNYGDSLTLKHEQGHFDICEIYARLLRRDIRKARSLAEAKEMFDRVSTEEELEHDQFDKANTYQNGGLTPAWRDRIIARLSELKQYKNPVVTVYIDK